MLTKLVSTFRSFRFSRSISYVLTAVFSLHTRTCIKAWESSLSGGNTLELSTRGDSSTPAHGPVRTFGDELSRHDKSGEVCTFPLSHRPAAVTHFLVRSSHVQLTRPRVVINITRENYRDPGNGAYLTCPKTNVRLSQGSAAIPGTGCDYMRDWCGDVGGVDG